MNIQHHFLNAAFPITQQKVTYSSNNLKAFSVFAALIWVQRRGQKLFILQEPVLSTTANRWTQACKNILELEMVPCLLKTTSNSDFKEGKILKSWEVYILGAWVIKYITHIWIILTGKRNAAWTGSSVTTEMSFLYLFFPLEIIYHALGKHAISTCYIWRKECTLKTLTRNHWSTTLSYIKAGTHPFQ